ncbi:MAG: Aldose 1-epimerase [Labilithrix sp.]|nr:Aldose 1-epimerase [Labilithrix sp.]
MLTAVNPSPFETVTLTTSDARVVIAPARGGMVTRFDVGGAGVRPVLYLDEATLNDPTQNVRGGIPVLFPSPGPLTGDRFTRDGKSGAMKKHGIARIEEFTVVSTESNTATLELASNARTREAYPYDFLLRIRYSLYGASLTVETTVKNTGTDGLLPFSLGFHPYFQVADGKKAQARIATDATRAFDNVGKKEVDVTSPLDLTPKEVDLHLFDHRPHEAALEREPGDRIVVAADTDFPRWVVWTLGGKDFVCLEPWTGPADALNTGDRLFTLAPGASKTLTMTIAAA